MQMITFGNNACPERFFFSFVVPVHYTTCCTVYQHTHTPETFLVSYLCNDSLTETLIQPVTLLLASTISHVDMVKMNFKLDNGLKKRKYPVSSSSLDENG